MRYEKYGGDNVDCINSGEPDDTCCIKTLIRNQGGFFEVYADLGQITKPTAENLVGFCKVI